MTLFDDAIGDMMNDLLSDAGESFVYLRGAVETALIMQRSVQPSFAIDSGNGMITEVHPVDFICRSSDFPYAFPLAGDRISEGSNVYEVNRTVSEKVYRQVNQHMLRIHAKKIGQ